MASKASVKDVGWMYHTPAKAQPRDEEHRIPVLSQIPLLNPDEIEDPHLANKQANYIKSTDSDYIAMCKMGGHKNLLSMKNPEAKSDAAVWYPKCDWYYLLDNQLEDNQNKPTDQVYRAQVPDYMVHDVIERRPKPVQNIQIQIEEDSRQPMKSRKKNNVNGAKATSKINIPKSVEISRTDIDNQKAKIAKKSVQKVEDDINMFTLLSYGYTKKNAAN